MIPKLTFNEFEDRINEKAYDPETYGYTLTSLQHRKKYREALRNFENKFKQDLFEVLNIEKHPKREILFRLSWERCHSYGYMNVYLDALDLVELIE